MKQVPILLLSGFLGSGKTTLVNWIIKHAADKCVSIILNEFGDVQLESQFVETDEAFVAELSGGCMCCIAKSDVPHVIHLILDKYPNTDYIVIEASGLSEPSPIKDTLSSPGLVDRVYLDKNICTIDTINFLANRKNHKIVMTQIADADMLVLTKTQDKKSKADQIRQELSSNMPDVPMVEISDKTSINTLLDAQAYEIKGDPKKKTSISDQKHSTHHHEQYDEFIFKTKNALDFEKFRTVLNHLTESIVRAKGFVRIVAEDGSDQKLLVQYVQGAHEFTTEAWEKNQEPQSAIVFLGKDFDKQELSTRLIACEKQ